MDPHKTDYVLRIGDEQGLTVLVDQGIAHYRRVGADAEAALARAVAKKDEPARTLAELEIRQTHVARARLVILKLEHMHYKHDSIAYALRIAAAAADKRAEVATIAASAAMQALEHARIAALHAHSAAQHGSSAAPSSSAVTRSVSATDGAAAEAEAAARAIVSANDARVVGDAAASLASAIAGQRGKPGYAVAAGVVARAMVVALAGREGSLLTAGAVDASRSAAEMETLADAEAPTALAEAEARGVDLGELHTAAVAAAQSAEIAAHGTASLSGDGIAQIDTAAVVAELASYVYAHGDPRSKTRAALMHMFHHALHDRFAAARDLLLMSKLQETITSTDVKVQVRGEATRGPSLLGPAAASAAPPAPAGPVQPLLGRARHGRLPLRPVDGRARVPRRALRIHAHQGAPCAGHRAGLPRR